MARGDHLRRHGRSGGTKYSATDGLGGPSILPWTVRGDQVFCHGRPGGTNFGGDQLSRDRTIEKGLEQRLLRYRPILYVHVYILGYIPFGGRVGPPWAGP